MTKRQRLTPLPANQQAVVQPNHVGFYPFNSLALTAIETHQAQIIIKNRQDNPTVSINAEQEDIKVGKTTVDLSNKVCNSISDAFYRGKLPEVLVITASMQQVPQFLEEVMDFLEKLITLGFITSNSPDDPTPLDQVIPQFVIATYGPVYQLIYQKVHATLEHMGSYNQWQQDRILQKFCRGFFTALPRNYHRFLEAYTLFDAPLDMILAGEKSLYSLKVSQVCQSHQLQCQLNTTHLSGTSEFELAVVYSHLLEQVYPRLDKAPISKDELKDCFEALAAALGIIPGMVTQAPNKIPMLKEPKSLGFDFTDHALMLQLKNWLTQYELFDRIPLVEKLLAATSLVSSAS